MIDVAKVADLVLLMIDGSFGFEMVRSLFILLLATVRPVLTFVPIRLWNRKRSSSSTSSSRTVSPR